MTTQDHLAAAEAEIHAAIRELLAEAARGDSRAEAEAARLTVVLRTIEAHKRA